MTPLQRPLRRLVIGIGNAWRGDDAVGLLVVRYLRTLLPEHIGVVEASGDGTSLLPLWADAELVILVDALQSGAAPGTIQRFVVNTAPLPRHSLKTSTHAFGIAEAIELARVLGKLPPVCLVYGIEGSAWEVGTGLSAAVETSLPQVVKRIQDDLKLR